MTENAELMRDLGALFSDAKNTTIGAAVDACGGDRDVATAVLHSAWQDMEAIRRADLIGAVHDMRKKRASEQEG